MEYSAIRWRTYAIDGTPVSIDRAADGEWVVRYGDSAPSRGRNLAETMGAAVGVAAQASLVAGSPEAWRWWIAEHAARIAAEAEA